MERKQNSGFSLIELIIVIAVMGIMTGMIALGVGYLSNADAKGITNEINSGLSDLKAETMAKNGAVYMHISRFEEKYYLDYTDSASYTPDGSGKEIGKSSVTVTCDGIDMANGADICFMIRKKDGAFATGASKIEISRNGAVDFTIQIVKATGRHYIE